MPRSKTNGASAPASTPAPADHNTQGGLTDDEAAALTTHHALNILKAQKVAALKKAEYDDALSAVNGHFKLVAKDLKFTRKEFDAEVIQKLGMTDAEYRSSEARRERIHRLAGLKQGDQLDLISHVLADTVDDAIAAEGDGYRAGRRADDPTPPTTIAPILHNDWLKGWHAGQEFNALQLAKAAEVLGRPKPGQMAPAPAADAAGEGEEDDGSPEALKRAADKLKADGWVEPTAAEAQFETSDNGRAIRKPKANGRAAVAEPAAV